MHEDVHERRESSQRLEENAGDSEFFTTKFPLLRKPYAHLMIVARAYSSYSPVLAPGGSGSGS